MNHRIGPTGYLLVLVILLVAAALAPGVWATPAQTRPGQTVPTPTPRVTRLPTDQPTAGPQPSATPLPPVTTVPSKPSPGSSPLPVQPTTTRTPARGNLVLTKESDRRQVWPAAVVQYTLILANTGDSSVRQVVLTDSLPPGLEPGSISQGEAIWDGRSLRAETPILPPGGRLVVVFTASVASHAPGGGVLVNRATATAAGGISVAASTTVILPPAELPPTGGMADCEWRIANGEWRIADCG